MLHSDVTHPIHEEMYGVFMNRQLPYAEYLTECGEHPMKAGYLKDGDAPFPKHYSAKYFFPDSGIEVSVIHGVLFHCGYDEPYEIMVTQGKHKRPFGYQTDEDLFILLTKIIGGSYDVVKPLDCETLSGNSPSFFIAGNLES
jgi:hypothetical protein